MILNEIRDAKYGAKQVSQIYLGANLIWPKLWNPLNLGRNLLFWFDAEDSSSLITVGTNVSRWIDKSGNNRDAIQGDQNRRPSVLLNGINGKQCLTNGSDINSGALTWRGDSINPTKVFVVADYDGSSPFDSLGSIAAFNFTASPDIPYFHPASGLRWAGTALRFVNGSTDGSNVSTGEPALPTISSPFLAHSGPQYPSSDRSSFTVCGERETSISGEPLLNRGWRGKVGEIFVVSGELSVEEIQKAEGYLAHKWNLTNVLPFDHPYKVNPPE